MVSIFLSIFLFLPEIEEIGQTPKSGNNSILNFRANWESVSFFSQFFPKEEKGRKGNNFSQKREKRGAPKGGTDRLEAEKGKN
jgi:inner membrane protein involved in colicin E2 resistance